MTHKWTLINSQNFTTAVQNEFAQQQNATNIRLDATLFDLYWGEFEVTLEATNWLQQTGKRMYLVFFAP